MGPDGQPVASKLMAPSPQPGGWFRFQLNPSGVRRHGDDGPDADRQRAWHGTKVQALYAILWDGYLRESASEEDGERFLVGARGVYLHSDEFRHKAEWYAPYLAVLPHVFWKVLIEASVDRS